MSEEAAVKEFDAKVTKIGDEIAGLSLKEAVDLADYMKDAYGIEPAAGGAVIAEEQEEEEYGGVGDAEGEGGVSGTALDPPADGEPARDHHREADDAQEHVRGDTAADDAQPGHR